MAVMVYIMAGAQEYAVWEGGAPPSGAPRLLLCQCLLVVCCSDSRMRTKKSDTKWSVRRSVVSWSVCCGRRGRGGGGGRAAALTGVATHYKKLSATSRQPDLRTVCHPPPGWCFPLVSWRSWLLLLLPFYF